MSTTPTARNTKIFLTKDVEGMSGIITHWMSLFEAEGGRLVKKHEWFLGTLRDEDDGIQGFKNSLIKSLANNDSQRFNHEEGEWILEYVSSNDGMTLRHRWGNFTSRMPEDFLEALKEAEITIGKRVVDSIKLAD